MKELGDYVRSLARRIAVEAWASVRHYISLMRMSRRFSRVMSAVRSVTAGAVILTVFLGPFESLLPDVHDDHGSVASARTPSDPGNASAKVFVARDVPPLDNSSDRTSGHRFRVDHCSHGHYLSLGTHVAVTIRENRELSVDTYSLELLSVSLSPHSRPPIA